MAMVMRANAATYPQVQPGAKVTGAKLDSDGKPHDMVRGTLVSTNLGNKKATIHTNTEDVTVDLGTLQLDMMGGYRKSRRGRKSRKSRGRKARKTRRSRR